MLCSWGIGFVLSIIGAIVFVFGQVTLFASEWRAGGRPSQLIDADGVHDVCLTALYTIGVVISLIGTGFLLGFLRQVKMMWDPVRRYAAAFFVLCIALTFVFAFAVRVDALVIVFAIATYLVRSLVVLRSLSATRADIAALRGYSPTPVSGYASLVPMHSERALIRDPL